MDTFQYTGLPFSVGNQSVKVATKNSDARNYAVLNNSGLSSQMVLSHEFNMILNSFYC